MYNEANPPCSNRLDEHAPSLRCAPCTLGREITKKNWPTRKTSASGVITFRLYYFKISPEAASMTMITSSVVVNSYAGTSSLLDAFGPFVP